MNNISQLILLNVEESGYQCWTFHMNGIKHWYTTGPEQIMEGSPTLPSNSIRIPARTAIFHYNNQSADDIEPMYIAGVPQFLPLNPSNPKLDIDRVLKLMLLS